ncbi:hypothetical protein C345_05106 [Cryptococcus neoformans A2-102-5]|nr:hypothetical protein C346_05218 [Cryptococcus neoformans var. grubii D17-1]OXG93436.1 hypothetical protein C345_05106 [Cryptococcus neoformans var. grubii A2-102-5]
MRRSVRDLRNSPGGRPLIIQQHQFWRSLQPYSKCSNWCPGNWC